MNCKNCEHNNNGWCKKYKAQKPNALKQCESDNCTNEESDNYRYILNGKVQQLNGIIRQVDASPEDVSIEFKKVLYSLYQMLLIEIESHGIKFDFLIDKDIYRDLVYRMNDWKKKYEL